MNPGEYVGKDGRTYRWEHRDTGYVHSCCYLDGETVWWPWVTINERDIPAAKAALDALVEAEGEEWVEWKTIGGSTFRARGNEIQWWYTPTGKWRSEHDSDIGCAYRKGRDVGLSERLTCHNCVKLAEARKLVEAVLKPPWPVWKHCDDCANAPTNERIIGLAKALEAKL